jgi:hypothetical protein
MLVTERKAAKEFSAITDRKFQQRPRALTGFGCDFYLG